MITHSIQIQDRIRKFPEILQNICFLELSEEFRRDSKASRNHPR